jgi:hypothetical protein
LLGNEKDLYVTGFHTPLINLNAGLGKRVRIGELSHGRSFVGLCNDALAPLSELRRAEKRENYAPVTIVIPSTRPEKSVTSQLFASGSLQISAQSPMDILRAYTFVVQFLCSHAATVLTELTSDDLRADVQKTSLCWPELMKLVAPDLVHTHLPCRFLVPGCSYCASYGNAFASS